jgi:multidrug efflux system outer membrane protein
MPPLPPAGLPSSLLERRPDVRAAEQTLLAANARIGVAKAAMFPSISLTGIAGGQSKDFNNLMQLPARIWTLGFGISLPLFDAGRNAARVEQAEARQRQSVAGYQKAVEAAFRETADALSNVALASEAEKAWQERLDSARHSLRLSMLRYEAGYSSYLEVLDAQRTANDTELGFIRNRQSRLAFSVDLMKVLGGGWTP